MNFFFMKTVIENMRKHFTFLKQKIFFFITNFVVFLFYSKNLQGWKKNESIDCFSCSHCSKQSIFFFCFSRITQVVAARWQHFVRYS